MSKQTALAVFVLAFSIPSTFIYARELETLKDVTEKWIQTRNRVSEEKASWATERELLKGSLITLESTQRNLQENIRILEVQTEDLQNKIVSAKEEIASFEKSDAYIESQIEGYEARILKLSDSLPTPLKDEISPLIRKISPRGTNAPPLANRLQNIVAISTLIDEFNNDLTLTNTIKELDDGSVIEVRVLYWGLAGAYASNADGSKAWIIKPATGDWHWEEAKEQAAAVSQLFEVYDKTIDPQLVEVPFSFTTKGGEQ